MILAMGGVDHTTAPLELRERLSFDMEQAKILVSMIIAQKSVTGAVLLSTCNRTELYVTGEPGLEHPGRLLCRAAGQDWKEVRTCFVRRDAEDAARHLMEVSAGLHSRIWGEEQILTQVCRAMECARECGSADAILNTLFQRAVTAGKAVKTHVTFTAVPASAASQAVALLEREWGSLTGRRAVVIGNGEMGRLSARLLQAAGAAVTVTLRRYHHRETIVPYGCTAVPYEDRLAMIDGADLLFSATTSPHYTFTKAQAKALRRCPSFLIDLAIPRDIEPEAALKGVRLLNVDDFGVSPDRTDAPALEQAQTIVAAHLDAFRQWQSYRDSLGAMEELKAALARRFSAHGTEDPQLVMERTVDLLLGGLKGRFDAQSLLDCAGKIDAFTCPQRRTQVQTGFRFPLFTDLRGKRVVIVGGGRVASRRIRSLLPFGPELTVISPDLWESVRPFTWLARYYQPGDLSGAALAVAATDSRSVNRQVGEEAHALGIPVSVADAPEESSFFFPALCQGSRVIAGVVSQGEDHTAAANAAREIRKLLEENEL